MILIKMSAQNKLVLTTLSDLPAHKHQQYIEELYTEEDDTYLYGLASKNRIASILAHALMNTYGSENLPPHWQQAHNATHARISAYLTELDRIAEVLAEAGIPVILLENGALARAIYPCSGCFHFGDFDLLIFPKQLLLAHKILVKQGYKFQSPDNRRNAGSPNTSNGRAEYEILLIGGYSLRLNLQSSLVARRWFNSECEPDVNTLFARSVNIPDSAALMLCPEDFLFQLSIHNASHGYVRKPGILLHLDVERFVRRVSIDWQKFINLLETFEMKTAAYFSLAIPKALFETPIPDEVLESLKPIVWKEQLITRWLNRVGLFNPDEQKFSKIGYIFFTALLYDDFSGLWRGVFPNASWMKERYTIHQDWQLPYYHIRRLLNLAFQRMNT